LIYFSGKLVFNMVDTLPGDSHKYHDG